MQFYEVLAQYYDQVFPLNKHLIDFCLKANHGQKVLDLGCATGELALALAGHGLQVSALDLDQQMIQIAKNKAATRQLAVEFQAADMTSALAQYPKDSFNLVSCFGNTLVHLLSEDTIKNLFSDIYNLLSIQGQFVGQLINYDNFPDKLPQLPLIETEDLVFQRSYQQVDHLLEFQGELTIKDTAACYQNSIKIMPLHSERLQELLQEAGFDNITLYNNCQLDSFSKDNLALYFQAQKT